MSKVKHLVGAAAMLGMPLLGAAQCAVSTVSLMGSGNTMAYTCPGDGMPDVLTFDHQTTATATYGYVVTDPNGIILGLPMANTQDFDGAPAGVCRVYGISYDGPLTGQVGDDINVVDLAQFGCCILSSNYIEVIREVPEGGNVYTLAGDTMVYTCPGDGNADVVEFMTMNTSNSNSQYVVTDINGMILGLPPANTQDFEGAPAGTCLVWHLSYTGNLTAAMGDDATMISFSDDCFDLSDDYVTIVREMPDGGNVYTMAGDTMVYTCPGDGNADVVEFMTMNTSNSNSQYVVTDISGIILGLPPGNMQDFEGAPAGTCLVWHLSYTGNLTAAMGDDATMISFSDDCFDLSDDYVTIVREMPDGGNVYTMAGDTMVYTCPGDGNADVVEFMTMNTSNSNSQYVVTDINGMILGLPPGNMQDFEGAPAGTCLVWHLSYTGNLTAAMGDDATMISFSDDCFDLSDDYVTIVREMPDGGNVYTMAGDTMVYTCPGDGNADVVEFMTMNTSNSNSQYVVTDINGMILGLPPGNTQDFEGAPAGTCLVWHLSYTGNLNAAMGDDATMINFSDDCFDLSDDYVTIVREMPEGGNVTTVAGSTMETIIAGDGVADPIMFAVANNSNSNSQYVVTDLNGIILGLPPANMVDFEGAGVGTCLVWHLSYTGNLTASMGDDANVISFSDDCYDLSDDFITVERLMGPGVNMVTTGGGAASAAVDLTSGQTVVDFATNANAAFSYQYVIVDQNDMIVALLAGNSYDFAQLTAGVYMVYGVLYQGNFTATIGNDITTATLSDSWFDVSTTAVTVDVSSTVGIGELNAQLNTLDVYPNPATQELNIGSTAGMNSIRITDLQGRNVLELPLQEGSELERVDVSGLNNGTYMIMVSTGDEVHVARFVKK